MTFVVTAWSEDPGELRDLYTCVIKERSIRGRVRIVEVAPDGDRLGPMTDSLQVTLGSPEAVAALAGTVTTWLGTRPGVALRLTRGEQEITVSEADDGELQARLAEMLDGDASRQDL